MQSAPDVQRAVSGADPWAGGDGASDLGLSPQVSVVQHLYEEARAQLATADAALAKARQDLATASTSLEESRAAFAAAAAASFESGAGLSERRERQMERDLDVRVRLVDTSVKVVELEQDQRNKAFERFLEVEKRLLESSTLPSTSLTQGPGHGIEGITPQAPPAKTRRRRPKAWQRPTARHRLTCHVPCHKFRLEDLQDFQSLKPNRRSSESNLPERGSQSPLSGLLSSGPRRSAPTHADLLLPDPVRRNSDAYRPIYGTVDRPTMYGLPNTVHDPTWVWDFEEESVAHAKRHVPIVMSSAEPDSATNELAQMQHVFVFDFGCVVLWNLPETHEVAMVSSLMTFGNEPSQPDGAEYANESVMFEAGPVSSIDNDLVTISTGLYGEILAYSFAIAQSSLLRLFEWRTQQVIDRNGHIPLTLIKDGRIHMNQHEIAHEIGWVFFERAKISLSDSTDPAQYFWEHSEWDALYSDACSYFDITERKERLNIKLAQLKELLDLLNAQTMSMHGVHLEWIVIWLIVIEVLCEIVWNILIRDVLGWFPSEIVAAKDL